MRKGRKHSNQHETPSATDIKSCWIDSSHTQLQRCHEQRLYEPHESICMHFKASYQQCALGQQMYLFSGCLVGIQRKQFFKLQQHQAPSSSSEERQRHMNRVTRVAREKRNTCLDPSKEQETQSNLPRMHL